MRHGTETKRTARRPACAKAGKAHVRCEDLAGSDRRFFLFPRVESSYHSIFNMCPEGGSIVEPAHPHRKNGSFKRVRGLCFRPQIVQYFPPYPFRAEKWKNQTIHNRFKTPEQLFGRIFPLRHTRKKIRCAEIRIGIRAALHPFPGRLPERPGKRRQPKPIRRQPAGTGTAARRNRRQKTRPRPRAGSTHKH